MLQRVFVDANVLLSRTTRDWLFLLRNETQQMFQLHSTIDVVTETVRARRRLQPELDGNITRRLHDDLIENLDEVVADFDGSIEFHGSDPHDRHVHATATAAASNFLLTSNGSDFGNPDLLPYEIYTPDEFFLLVDDGAQDSVRRVTQAQLKYWSAKRARGHSVKPLPAALTDAGCPLFADRVNRHVRFLAGPPPR